MDTHYYDRHQLTEAEIIVILVSAFIWLLAWLGFVTKMGFKGKTRWYLVLSSLIPLLGLINFFVLACVGWPVWAELRTLRKKVNELSKTTTNLNTTTNSNLDADLERLRKDMNL